MMIKDLDTYHYISDLKITLAELKDISSRHYWCGTVSIQAVNYHNGKIILSDGQVCTIEQLIGTINSNILNVQYLDKLKPVLWTHKKPKTGKIVDKNGKFRGYRTVQYEGRSGYYPYGIEDIEAMV